LRNGKRRSQWPRQRRRPPAGASRTARVAGGQDYEVRYEANKKHRSKAAVKKAVKKVGSSRKRVDRALGRKTK
jgi:hypothetical protein